jgi:hypothetical protein
MTIRTFFGKVRRKLFRILLGRDLFIQLTNFDEKINLIENNILQQFDSKINQVNDNINLIDGKINNFSSDISRQINSLSYESHSYYHELIKHIHESKTIGEINTKAFAKYRSIYKDHDIVVMGAGPTLNHYVPKENCISIGTNGTVLNEKVKLDFLFVQDVGAIRKYENEILAYDCKKFFNFWGSFSWNIPIKYRKIKNMEEYCSHPVAHISSSIYIFKDGYASHSIPLNICDSPLSDFDSVIFPAVQFALWTYPKRIFIVGCDCSRIDPVELNMRHFYYENANNDDKIYPVEWLVQGWRKIKEFQQIYYPDVEMVSINPVFLKGLFKDEYTASYLEDNPDAASND